MTRVLVVPAPDGFCGRHNLPNSDPVTTLLTFTARPARRAWPIGQDMLGALGIDFGLADNGRSRNEDFRFIKAWMRAWNIRLVIVRHGENLVQAVAIDALIEVCRSADADVVFVTEGPETQRLINITLSRGGDVLPVEEFFPYVAEVLRSGPVGSRRQTSTKRRGATSTQVEGVEELASITGSGKPLTHERTSSVTAPPDDYPQRLPRVAFPLFRASCRQLLSATAYLRVDALYIRAYQYTAQRAPRTNLAAAHVLRDLIAAHPSTGEALTIARACQAQLFTEGLQLQISMPAFLVAVEDGTHRRLTTTEVHSLRAYRTPWRSCIVLLDDAGLTRDQIAAVRMSNVSPVGEIIGVPAIDPALNASPARTGDTAGHRAPRSGMHPDAAVFFRAQRHLRRASGATDTDPLLSVNELTVHRTLRQVRADLGLPRMPSGRPATVNRNDRWQHDIGCLLRPLTGPVRSLRAPQ